MQDLIDKTHSQHFELYRRTKLEDMGFSDGDGEAKQMSLQETYELRRQDYVKDIQGREEQMRQSFVNKVKEKEAELKQAEQEVRGFTVALAFSLERKMRVGSLHSRCLRKLILDTQCWGMREASGAHASGKGDWRFFPFPSRELLAPLAFPPTPCALFKCLLRRLESR